MHVPKTTVDEAIATAKALDADCTVAIGGGSTTGLGKALKLRLSLPNVVVPTSFAGSEMTNIWGITDAGRKVTGRDDAVVPALTLYDPELTLTMPTRFAVVSGLNAMAQAVVNVASDRANPMVETMAVEAVRSLAISLPQVVEKPDDLDARSGALFGACLAGAALATGTTSLHHKLCHTFGGTFNTPHAETHAILLPHSMAFNAPGTALGMAKLARAMEVDDAAIGVYELARRLGSPLALEAIGVRQSDLREAAEITASSEFHNPVPVTVEGVLGLLERAFSGAAPQTRTS